MKVKMIGKKSGSFQVKYMPTGKNANDIRSYLKEYEIKTGKKVDIDQIKLAVTDAGFGVQSIVYE